MDEHDLYRALQEPTDFFRPEQEKTASIQEQGGKLLQYLKKPETIGAVVGGAVTALGSYGVAKRWNPEKPSIMENHANKGLKSVETAEKAREISGEQAGFHQKLHGIAARSYAQVAKLLAEHPKAALTLFTYSGAQAGGSLVKHVKSTLKKVY